MAPAIHAVCPRKRMRRASTVNSLIAANRGRAPNTTLSPRLLGDPWRSAPVRPPAALVRPMFQKTRRSTPADRPAAQAEANVRGIRAQETEAEAKTVAAQSTYERLKAASATLGVVAATMSKSPSAGWKQHVPTSLTSAEESIVVQKGPSRLAAAVNRDWAARRASGTETVGRDHCAYAQVPVR
jgi:hypothetical protein